MDDGILVKNAQIYADRHQIQLAARLGSGFHGIIFNTVGNLKAGQSGRTGRGLSAACFHPSARNPGFKCAPDVESRPRSPDH